MKIEVEITEAEIKSAIERKIRVAIADEVNGWNADNYIKDQVRKCWKEIADKVIQDECNNAPKLHEKINAALVNKIKGQLNAALKVKT